MTCSVSPCPALDQLPLQGAPCLVPSASWDRLQAYRGLELDWWFWKMDGQVNVFRRNPSWGSLLKDNSSVLTSFGWTARLQESEMFLKCLYKNREEA